MASPRNSRRGRGCGRVLVFCSRRTARVAGVNEIFIDFITGFGDAIRVLLAFLLQDLEFSLLCRRQDSSIFLFKTTIVLIRRSSGSPKNRGAKRDFRENPPDGHRSGRKIRASQSGFGSKRNFHRLSFRFRANVQGECRVIQKSHPDNFHSTGGRLRVPPVVKSSANFRSSPVNSRDMAIDSLLQDSLLVLPSPSQPSRS